LKRYKKHQELNRRSSLGKAGWVGQNIKSTSNIVDPTQPKKTKEKIFFWATLPIAIESCYVQEEL
jgi:hypothetical protein